MPKRDRKPKARPSGDEWFVYMVRCADGSLYTGIATPAELPGRDPYALYDDLCRLTGQRHDPCLLDTFIAAVRYMEGAPKLPWWKYTAERKREMAARNAGDGSS